MEEINATSAIVQFYKGDREEWNATSAIAQFYNVIDSEVTESISR